MPQLQSLSNKHEVLIEYLLIHPQIKLKEVAAHFQVSQSWLSIIIHSDMFQKKLAERRKETYGEVLVNISERMTGIAHLALEKLGDQIENEQSIGVVLETADMILGKLGYGSKGQVQAPIGQVNIQNNYAVPAEVIAAARQNFGKEAAKVIETQPAPIEPSETKLHPELITLLSGEADDR